MFSSVLCSFSIDLFRLIVLTMVSLISNKIMKSSAIKQQENINLWVHYVGRNKMSQTSPTQEMSRLRYFDSLFRKLQSNFRTVYNNFSPLAKSQFASTPVAACGGISWTVNKLYKNTFQAWGFGPKKKCPVCCNCWREICHGRR